MSGYPLDTTPFLRELADRGVRFENAFAHSSTTAPSHSSMFTSLYPIQHRVRTNGHVLDANYVTVAEVLRAEGYSTAAFVSGMAHFGGSQILQGFDHFDQPQLKEREGASRLKRYRTARRTMDRAIDWIGDHEDEKWFVWVHFYDPHPPLKPPPATMEQLRPKGRTERSALRDYLRNDLAMVVQGGARLPRLLRYAAEILSVDQELRRLDEFLRSRDQSDRLAWIVTSDHGEGLGNHGWFGHHVQIYNVQLRVPLILALSGGESRGVVSDSLVSHVDLTPTIVELAGLEEFRQIVPIQGKSLGPFLRGELDFRPHRQLFAERRMLLRENTSGTSQEPGERFALQTLSHKYIWFSDGPDEFYDLIEDPHELRNLIGEGLPEEETLREALLDLVARYRIDEDADIVSESELDELRALGYLQ